MIRQQNELGEIKVGSNVYTNIAGNAATKCFGVKGMAIRSVSDGLVHLLRRESMAKGVLVRVNEDESISIGIVEARGMKNWQSAFWASWRAASSITGRSPATSFFRLPGMRRIRFLFGSPWK